MQVYGKNLPLGSDQDSWIKHSPNTMIAKRCANFANDEHRHSLLDFDTAMKTRSAAVPKKAHKKHVDQGVQEKAPEFFK